MDQSQNFAGGHKHKHRNFLHLHIVITSCSFSLFIANFLWFDPVSRRVVDNDGLVSRSSVPHSQDPAFAFPFVLDEDVFSVPFVSNPYGNFYVGLSDRIGRCQKFLC